MCTIVLVFDFQLGMGKNRFMCDICFGKKSMHRCVSFAFAFAYIHIGQANEIVLSAHLGEMICLPNFFECRGILPFVPKRWKQQLGCTLEKVGSPILFAK